MTPDEYNKITREANAALGFKQPVGALQFIHVDEIQANDYNPNSVPINEMRLLHTSIKADGYTQPVVTIWDDDLKKYIIIDGFHRYTVMRTQKDIYETTGGYLPIVVLEKDLVERVAATVRHNRARGKHSVDGMSNLVFKMLQEGKTDTEICNEIGLEGEELLRLKHITGFSKLMETHEYTDAWETSKQVQNKGEYIKKYPDMKDVVKAT